MKPFIITCLILIACFSGKAQVLRLYATVSKSYSVPFEAAKNHTDSTHYYYSGDNGLSKRNGNFISDSFSYFSGDELTGKVIHIYDSLDNLLKEYRKDSGGNLISEMNNIYDSANRLKRMEYTNHSSTGVSEYFYDGNGNKIEEHVMNISGIDTLMWKLNYTYDANNNKIHVLYQYGNSPQYLINAKQWFYTYNAQNNLAEMITETWDDYNGVWIKNSRETYSYNGNDDLILTEFFGWLSIWNILGKTECSYDAHHNLTEKTIYDWANSNYTLSQKYNYTYTTFNQPQSMLWVRYFSGITYYENTYYYYGMHWPLKIAGTGNTGEQVLQLFPNPASTFITLKVSWQQPKTISFFIYDMHGRLYNHWQETAVTAYEKNIPVSDIPAGNYLLTINGDINSVQSFTIIR